MSAKAATRNQTQQKTTAAPVLTGPRASRGHKSEAGAGNVECLGDIGSILLPSPCPPCEVSTTTEDDLDKIRRNAPDPTPVDIQRTTPIDEAIDRDLQEKTTVQVRGDTRKKLDELKSDLDQPDVNGVISVLIDSYPGKKSTDDEVTLVMPRRRLDWLMAWQRNSDCSELLKTSVR